MLDINEINREIQVLENCNITNYAVCKKLAILYTIKDHYKGMNNNELKIDNMGNSIPKMMTVN